MEAGPEKSEYPYNDADVMHHIANVLSRELQEELDVFGVSVQILSEIEDRDPIKNYPIADESNYRILKVFGYLSADEIKTEDEPKPPAGWIARKRDKYRIKKTSKKPAHGDYKYSNGFVASNAIKAKKMTDEKIIQKTEELARAESEFKEIVLANERIR